MRKLLGLASLLTAALLGLTPASALAQNNKNGAAQGTTPDKATQQDYDALLAAKQAGGKIFYIDSNAKTITLRVDIPQYTPNPNYRPTASGTNNYSANRSGYMQAHQQQQMNQLMQQMNQGMHGKNPAQVQAHMAQMAQRMQMLEMQAMMQAGMQAQQQMAQAMRNANSNNGPFKVTMHQKDFELEYPDNVSVKKMFLATEYDDQGKPKPASKTQLADLKSGKGIAAKFEDVQPGQEVVLYVSKSTSKQSTAKSDDKKADDAKKAPAADPAAGSVNRPHVTSIVMTREMASTDAPAQAPPKKNK